MARKSRTETNKKMRVRREAEAADRASSEGDAFEIVSMPCLTEAIAAAEVSTLGSSRLRKKGIEPIELKRLLRPNLSGEKKTLNRSLLTRLVGAAPDEKRPALLAAFAECLLAPNERGLLETSEAWMGEQLVQQHAVAGAVPIFANSDRQLRFVDRDIREEKARRESEFSALCLRVKEVLPRVCIQTVGHPERRHWLMWHRILDPLLQWQASGFTERHWDELTDDELRRFVCNGIENEGILADRSDDVTRVRGALGMPRASVSPEFNEFLWDAMTSLNEAKAIDAEAARLLRDGAQP